MSGPYIQQLSGSYIQQLRDRIDFIEFKQNILFLKPPHHKAPVFAQLSLDEFIKIRELTYMYSYRIENNERLTISDYEKELLKMVGFNDIESKEVDIEDYSLIKARKI